MAEVSPNTVSRVERSDALYGRTIDALQAALEAAGAIFIDENGEGLGCS